MKRPALRSSAGFTLVELIIGMTLAMVITTGVMSTYLFLGRNLARLSYQQKLESEGRRALQYFAQDVRLASLVTSVTASASVARVTFTVQTVNGEKNLTYYYNATSSTVTPTISTSPSVSITVPANTLVRYDAATGITTTLVSNLLDLDFTYYDTADDTVTDFTNSLKSIKKIAMNFTSQTGDNANGTQTPIHYGVSPRLLLRNKALLY